MRCRQGKNYFGLSGSIFKVLLIFLLLMSVSTNVMARELLVKEGSKGSDVIKVQSRLIAKGYLINSRVDGICGPITTEAIKKFQKANSLRPDGICDMHVYKFLDPDDAKLVEAAPEIQAGQHFYDHIQYEAGIKVPIWVRATAYSPYDGYSQWTATGKFLTRGMIAVDPSVIPLGTRVYIPGYGEAVAEDTGGSIIGNRIDIAFDTYYEAIQFGVQDLEIYILY